MLALPSCSDGSIEGQNTEMAAGGSAGSSTSTAGSGSGSSAAGAAGSSTVGGSGGTTSSTAGQGGTGSAGSSNPSGGSSGSGTSGTAGSAGSPPVETEACKRGVAWYSDQTMPAALMPGVTWWYNWGPGGTESADLEFVPMIWGGEFDVGNVVDDIPSGAAHLLGFNEPNFFEQANLSAQDAAAAWPGVENVAAQLGLPIASPAVNFCGDDATKTGPCHDTNPLDYLTDFFAACQGCKVDYVAVHWYNCSGADLTWYLDQFKAFGKPIWLTEFACGFGGDTSVAGQEAYMREAIPILEQDPAIMRYAWFSGDPMPNARLLDDNGQVTSLGQVYVDLPRACAQ